MATERNILRNNYKWEDNIKMDLRGIRIDGEKWIWVALDRV
jgi:hypothetical protein